MPFDYGSTFYLFYGPSLRHAMWKSKRIFAWSFKWESVASTNDNRFDNKDFPYFLFDDIYWVGFLLNNRTVALQWLNSSYIIFLSMVNGHVNTEPVSVIAYVFGQEEAICIKVWKMLQLTNWNLKNESLLTCHVGGESEVGEEPAAEGELTLPGGHAQVQLLLQQLLHLTGRQRYLSWIRSFKKSQENGRQQLMKEKRMHDCIVPMNEC